MNYVPLSAGGYVMPQIDDYQYDPLNRIQQVSESQQSSAGQVSFLFTQKYAYDRWGNRTIDVPGTTPSIPGVTRKSFVVDAATNRLTSSDGCAMTYDSAGNQTYDCVGTHYYDAENRMTKAVQGSSNNYYFYDGNGKRVRRILNGSQTWGGQETWFVYGFEGELAAEYAYNQVTAPLATAPQKEYGYRGGKLLIVWDGTQAGDDQLKWLVTDHLGSTRMEANKSGSLATIRRHDYLPFGEELVASTGAQRSQLAYGYEPPPTNVRQRFTGKERDTETGLDFFEARYFASVQGRFTSADPLFIEMKRLPYPQAWNLYAYTRNNPLKYVDLDGLDIKVTCANGKLCDETITNLNNRKNAQFKIELKDGKLAVVGKVDTSKLDKSERQLYNAITDTKNTAEIQIRAGSDAIDFAQYAKPGFNIIDGADVRQLNKVDQRLAGEVIAHEALEAYAGVAEGKSNFTEAHRRANEFFGEAVILTESIAANPRGANPTYGGQATYNFRRLGIQMPVQKLFISPQPAESLPNNWERIRGNLRVVPPEKK